MTTYVQTVVIQRPLSSLEFVTELRRPVLPAPLQSKLKYGQAISLVRKSDSSEITWYPDGDILELKPNGEVHEYLPKPTKQEVISHLVKEGTSSFAQFHPNGTVTLREKENTYYWGPDIHAIPADSEFDGWDDYEEEDLCSCYGQYCSSSWPNGYRNERWW